MSHVAPAVALRTIAAGYPTERQWQEMADLEMTLFFPHRAENRLETFRAEVRQRGQHFLYIEHPRTGQSLGYCLYGLSGISAQIVKLAVHPQWHRRGYGRAWEKIRLAILREEPLCRGCQGPATCVDHIKPLKDGGTNHRPNLQPLCASCHNSKTWHETWGKKQ